jgi:hypothetical protein
MESRGVAPQLRHFGESHIGVLFVEAVRRPAGVAARGRMQVIGFDEPGCDFVGSHLTTGSSDRGVASSMSQGGDR